jgi:hypothetical protein
MKKAVSIKQFKEARDYMDNLVVDTLQSLEVAIYDPWLKLLFEKETKALIASQFKDKYPDINIYFSFSIYLSAQTIEYSVQRHYHPYSQHIFLGSIHDPKRGKGKKKPFLVDCYYSALYEPFGEPRIIVRYGDGKKEYDEGTLSAAEQFFRGLDTPLAKGYQLALEAGYVSA